MYRIRVLPDIYTGVKHGPSHAESIQPEYENKILRKLFGTKRVNVRVGMEQIA